MKYLVLSFCFVVALGCKGDFVSSKVEQAYADVMEVHDAVMPEMSTLNKLRKQVKKIDGESASSLDMIKQLKDANEGMMVWMSEFDLDRKAPEKSQLEYLRGEQIKIQKVSDDMNGAMTDAREYIISMQK